MEEIIESTYMSQIKMVIGNLGLKAIVKIARISI